MSPHFIINAGLTTPPDRYEAAPVCSPVRRAPTPLPAPKGIADIASGPHVTECSPLARDVVDWPRPCRQQYKLSISSSRLDALENGLLVTFACVTALLAVTITALPY